MAGPEDITRQFVQAINQRDLGRIGAMMSEDHRFIDSLGEPIEGRESMRDAWRRYFEMMPAYTIEVGEVLAKGNVVALLGKASGTYRVGGERGAETYWETPAAWRAVVREGRIAEWQVYADNEPVRRLMRGASEAK